jgi:hypothetical protein
MVATNLLMATSVPNEILPFKTMMMVGVILPPYCFEWLSFLLFIGSRYGHRSYKNILRIFWQPCCVWQAINQQTTVAQNNILLHPNKKSYILILAA